MRGLSEANPANMQRPAAVSIDHKRKRKKTKERQKAVGGTKFSSVR